MSGWEKVIAATVLAVVGLAGLNLAIWRRMQSTAMSVFKAENKQQRFVDALQIARVKRTDNSADVGETHAS